MCVKTDYKFATVWDKMSENRRGYFWTHKQRPARE